MSGELRAKLVAMANQIATALDGQGGDAIAGVAGHLQSFWPRPMRDEIVSHLAAGGEGLTPTARAAVSVLAATLPKVGQGA